MAATRRREADEIRAVNPDFDLGETVGRGRQRRPVDGGVKAAAGTRRGRRRLMAASRRRGRENFQRERKRERPTGMKKMGKID